MSTADYPSFHTLNQSEPESLSILDQAVTPYPSMDEAAYDNLMVNRFFDQFLNLTAQYNDLPSLPALNIPSDIKEMITLEQSPPPTRQLTGPVRLKHTHPRVLHACDYCRHRKTKCSGEQPVCQSCKKRGRTCTWTPIKRTKTRPCPSPSHGHGNSPSMGHGEAPYPNIMISDMHSGVTLASAVHSTHALSAPSYEFFASQSPSVEDGWSDSSSSDLSQMWISLPPSYPPSSSSAESLAPPFHTSQKLHNHFHSPVASSFSLAASATEQYVHPAYASSFHVPA